MRVLKNYFSQLSAGRIPEVRSLRRNDEFRDVHEAFGDAMALLRAQKHQEVERITQALVSLERAGRCDAAERERALSSIRVALSGLREQATAAFSSNGQPGLEPKESKTVDHRAADESRSRRSRGTGIQTAVTNAAPI